MKKKTIAGMAVLLLSAAAVWHPARLTVNPSWEQPTMGTACHITLCGKIRKKDLSALQDQITTALHEINRSMSIWDAESEISRFNRHSATAPFAVSEAFLQVTQCALELAEKTSGAFDPTVKPLVEHWGFGPERDAASVETLLQKTGHEKIKAGAGALIKLHPGVQLDLAALAKGYGSDRVAGVIRGNGITNFLVEIGGEIVAEGLNRSGHPWMIGIESPESVGLPFGSKIFRTVALSGRAMATSGDYRNFREREDGSRFSHIIDPHTGRPAESRVASVTVLAGTCMEADAIATALCVMGPDQGLQWLARHHEFQAFFILHGTNGTLQTAATPGFP